MSDMTTGQEPALSGAPFGLVSSGQEPMLGGERLIQAYRDEMMERLNRRTTTHLRRASIGRWLDQTNDIRPGVGIEPDNLPDLVWCHVPAGEVLVGDFPAPFQVEPFYIAKYPVTWTQYRIFLEAPDGFIDPQWWDGLQRRPEYERAAIPIDNHPVQEVSWYDALAYCRWLSDRLGYTVRLPTEWEWQQAATGGKERHIYPWGRRWNTVSANTRESGLRGATAVGMYPYAESPVGAVDMCGNVLEWCLNEYYRPDRVEIGGEASRVMRGGSWFLTLHYARTVSRVGDNPCYRFNSVGFRLTADEPVDNDEVRRRRELQLQLSTSQVDHSVVLPQEPATPQIDETANQPLASDAE
ncbi:MAG: SUMF1/EgtB/PvdO family nonheme iron enzyme [Anaerolineae bacterium]|nr:SUMF1/EgtB/PvdO family nonheme iron enzyme [Anaerolineae bacterium]